jgi:hypothetical protein
VKVRIIIAVVCVGLLVTAGIVGGKYWMDRGGDDPQLASSSDHGVHLGPGDRELRRGERLATQNGSFVLSVQKSGAVTEYAKDEIVWSTMTDDVVRFVMQDDCNLVAYAKGGVKSWSSDTAGVASNCTLRLQESDGNLVVIAPGNVPIWQRP